jgi:hypothetical protein
MESWCAISRSGNFYKYEHSEQSIVITTMRVHEERSRTFEHGPIRSVLNTLAYADVFRWPVSAEDVAENGCYPFVSVDESRAILNMLEASGAIYRVDDLYSMSNDPHQWLMRADRVARSRRMMPAAQRVGRLLSLFPFTRSICISGSLSKGSMDVTGDVDWFIITAPGRLWLCRSMLIAFKKIFLLNSKKYFCVNHIIDARNLTVKEHDLFTATEITTLIPVVDNGDLASFVRANPWVLDHFPAWRGLPTRTLPHGTWFIKRAIEAMLGGKVGDALERWAYARWQDFVQKRTEGGRHSGISFTPGTAQYQPDDVRGLVMSAYHARLRLLMARVTSETLHG